MGEVYLVSVESFANSGDPRAFGFDAAAEFPGHQVPSSVLYGMRSDAKLEARVLDYPGYAAFMMNRAHPGYKRFRAVLPMWDNTPRMGARASLFAHASPALYREWLARAVRHTREEQPGDERILLVNAWNEWGEGCHLEPDQVFGLEYLRATQAGLADGNLPGD